MLGLLADQIDFIGCATAPFLTQVISSVPPYRFRITYPTKGDPSRREHIAPILHEIGHAYQLKPFGSKKKLLASLDGSIERAELGADFLAGLAAQRLKMNPGDFETNLSLMGSYHSKNSESHGRPEDRAMAFRYGWNSPPRKSFDDSQYEDFQDNEFAQIKHSGASQ
jgi:hypothetical protein